MPRASWKGFLRLSLVSCPIYLSPATTRTKSIRLHQVWQPKASRAPSEDLEEDITAAACAPDTTQTFCSLLHYTGCNFTEALKFTAGQVDFSGRTILFQRPIRGVYGYDRAVPVPDSFIALLDQVHDLRRAQSGLQAGERVWPQSKKTVHEKVSRVIAEAGIAGGPHAVPKGIRHGFLVEAVRRRIVMTRTAEWMGYSHIDYIGQYAVQLALHAPEILGDERADAALMW